MDFIKSTKRLSDLSQIDLSQKEIESFSEHIHKIYDWFSKIDNYKIEQSNLTPQNIVDHESLRHDKSSKQSQDLILKNASKSEFGCFVVNSQSWESKK